MEIKKRRWLCSLIEKMEKNQECSKRLGLEDITKIYEENMEGKNNENKRR